jgi:hypothetical protein
MRNVLHKTFPLDTVIRGLDDFLTGVEFVDSQIAGNTLLVFYRKPEEKPPREDGQGPTLEEARCAIFTEHHEREYLMHVLRRNKHDVRRAAIEADIEYEDFCHLLLRHSLDK